MQSSLIELYVYICIYGVGKLNQKDFPLYIIIFIGVQRNTDVTVVREKKMTSQRECLQDILYHQASSMMLSTSVKTLNKN